MMNIKYDTPKAKGYTMPAEYDIHDGTLMVWPVRPGSWGKDSTSAKASFCQIFSRIIKSEKLYPRYIFRNIYYQEELSFNNNFFFEIIPSKENTII